MGCVASKSDLDGNIQANFQKTIATGGFSEIVKAIDIRSNVNYAVKKIQIHSQGDRTRAEKEAGVQNLMSKSLYAVRLLDFQSTDKEVFLVFPYFPLGTLAQQLEHRRGERQYMNNYQIARNTLEMLRALRQLHGHGWAHMDLKPENIMMTGDGYGTLLTDFGSAHKMPYEISDGERRQYMLDYSSEQCSILYRSPELFELNIGTTLDFRVDSWSLGCVLYAMIFFSSPFESVHTTGGTVSLAVLSPERVEYLEEAPADKLLKTLVGRLLCVNPSDRIELDDLEKILKKILEALDDKNAEKVMRDRKDEEEDIADSK